MKTQFADIVLRLAVPKTFQFSVPEDLQGHVRPGQRVRVPLRNRSDIGYVAGLSDTPLVKGIRPITAIIDREPLLPPDLLALLLWTASHTLSPPGLVFRAALPRAIHFEATSRATARKKKVRRAELAVSAGELPPLLAGLGKKAPRQARLLEELSEGPLTGTALSDFPSATLKVMADRGWIRLSEVTLRRGLVHPLEGGPEEASLDSAQQTVFDRIAPTLSERRLSPFLLHGVTGSGKSEIYLKAVQELPPDRQAIILVPEVSLTIQLIRHFQERLPFPLAVWHHQLSEGEKYDLWRSLREGEVRVVVGARSAVFAPLPNPGLIVLDEEQESSYKQEDAPSYHARDVAMKRGDLSGATVILGSATPSLESYYRAEEGAYGLLTLGARYGGATLPAVEMIDLKGLPRPAKKPPGEKKGDGRALLSAPLVDAAASALEHDEQVLFLLNRRGFAPFTHCGDCGQALKCPNCQVSLVFHLQDRVLLCHYCGHRDAPPETCPSCKGTNLRLSGSGTQRLEGEIRGLFPGKAVDRLDRDSTARKGAGSRVVTDFASGKTDILVGTQMAAKGLHFPRLTTVGVLDPDLSLNLPDFRAAERTFQLVTQVSGRAGRGEKPGKVLIQTNQPEHYALQAARYHDFPGFYRQELEFRRELDYPPFFDLVLLRLDGPTLPRVEMAAEELGLRVGTLLADTLKSGDCHLLGPVSAPLARIRNRHRCHLLVKCRPLEAATGPLRSAAEELSHAVRRRNCRLTIDVNPQNLM